MIDRLIHPALCLCLLPPLAAQQIGLPKAALSGTQSAQPAAPAINSRVKVLVLDALSGQPHEGIEVFDVCEDGGTFSPSQKTKTDASGIASVTPSCPSDVKVRVSTYIEGDKLSECGAMEGQILQKILEVGIVSDPRAAGGIWCPATISKKIKPVPGQVILLVKKPTWWQVHVAG
jgi:hypothetical protein